MFCALCSITNNITGNATHRVLQGASDANGIFKYKGLWHAMEQPWAHAVSTDGEPCMIVLFSQHLLSSSRFCKSNFR
jgi:hypothetical protein